MAASARTPGEAAWPSQMITQAEAFALAADWPIYITNVPHALEPSGDISLLCRRCSQSCGQLQRAGVTYNGSLDEMLAMVLRHMVMAHDISLAGLRKPGHPSPKMEEIDGI